MRSGHGDRRASLLSWSALALAALLASFASCSHSPGTIFPPLDEPLVWPPAPDPPRIRYVGQVRSSADLKPGRSTMAAITDLFVGEREPVQLVGPRAVLAIDGTAIWIADSGSRALCRFDLQSREALRIDRIGERKLLSPVALCEGPAGSVYVCDSEDVSIHRISATNGQWIETVPLQEEVGRPVDMHYDAAARELFVVDILGHDIKVLGTDGAVRRVIGRRGTARGEFNFPCDIASDGDRLWVLDVGNQRVQGLTWNGEPEVVIGEAGDSPGSLALPKSIALDSDGHLYVVDARFENVQIFDRSGRLLLFFGQEGTGAGEFWLPTGIHIDRGDRIWVCDSYNKRLQVFEYIKEGVNHDETS